MNRHSFSNRQESGFALVAALIILLVITLIGISGMDETIMEERMVTNFRDRAMADNASESTVRKAEFWISQQKAKPDEVNTTDCTSPPLCGSGNDYVVWQTDDIVSAGSDWNTMSWSDWTSKGVLYEGTGATNSQIYGVTQQPRALIEFRAFNPQDSSGMVQQTDPSKAGQGIGPYYYNIVGAGVGARSETMAVVETTYRQWY